MRVRFLVFSFLLIWAQAAQAKTKGPETIHGRVVYVYDGDTVKLLTPDNVPLKIRLNDIDAPETAQPYGPESGKALAAMILDHDVTIIKTKIDQYGRIIGKISDGGMDINLAMVKAGNAWAYRQYLDDNAYLAAETEARMNKRGLWALPAADITPPWDWRHTHVSPYDGPSQGSFPPAR